jgi:transposase
MLYVGLDLSRHRVDVHVLDSDGERVLVTKAPSHADGLRHLAERLNGYAQPVLAAIESMNGARFVHDQLELAGWDVDIADAQKVKGLAPLACKTDRIDAWVLAELSRRDLVPAIWLPTPGVRAVRERARWRLHLVHHHVVLQERVHATLMTFGLACPVSDLFGLQGRELLQRLTVPEPWAGNVAASVRLADELQAEIRGCERDLRTLGSKHPYVPLLMTTPGIAWVLGYTIAAEIGDITRFAAPSKLVGYTGLCPRVYQSGAKGPARVADQERSALPALGSDRGGHSRLHPPALPRALHTDQGPAGQQRGPKVARVELARNLAEAIWYMLTRNQPFAPAGARTRHLAA